MFMQGFDKTAGLGYPVGRAVGAASTATKKVKGAVSGYMAKQKAGFISGARKSTTGLDREPGAILNKARESAGKPADLGKAQKDVLARKGKMDASKKAGKPSFARKHPFITAGALYIGAKSALGGSDDKQQSQPQYVGPQ